jgi:hypothetical protein
MINIEIIKDQVTLNCDISDSKYAGLFSVCGLALRLRDMYKWEKGLAPWIEKDTTQILDWIGNKEQHWEHLSKEDYKTIYLNDETYDPFDTIGINNILESEGVFYGAGYGRSLKPTFLLAEIKHKKRINGCNVYVLGKELARDLFTVPAFVQEDSIVIRTHSARTFLWDRILYVHKSGKPALVTALKDYGLNYSRPQDLRNLKPHLQKISDMEVEVYIHHELGELQDTDFNRNVWREIIAAYPQTPIELLARTIKDLLADTNDHGTFQHIIKERKLSSLAFYVAFMESLPKTLFPSIIEAFDDFMTTKDWSVIAAAVSAGHQIFKNYAQIMTRIFNQAKQKDDYQWGEQEITRQLLKPLGI